MLNVVDTNKGNRPCQGCGRYGSDVVVRRRRCRPLCDECDSAKKKRDYQKVKKHDNARSKARKDRAQEIIKDAKRRPCADCGKEYPFYVMDLDHVRGVKMQSLSKARWMGWSEERIKNEIAKCDVVCANCHRERTFGAYR